MTLTNDHKKALFVVGVGLLVFWIFKPKLSRVTSETKINYSDNEADPKDRTPMKTPTMSAKTAQTNPLAKNGFAALKGYIDAYNNGEPQSVLDELNREFAKEFKVKVYRRKSDSKLVVCDLNGKEIMVNN
jgi:hypothetical protein